MFDISFDTACKELKIAQIAQLNLLFQVLHLAHTYGHCFYWVSRFLMSKNVNNDVSKDSPIPIIFLFCVIASRGLCRQSLRKLLVLHRKVQINCTFFVPVVYIIGAN